MQSDVEKVRDQSFLQWKKKPGGVWAKCYKVIQFSDTTENLHLSYPPYQKIITFLSLPNHTFLPSMWCVGCFSRFLNCANGTKSRNASHIPFQTQQYKIMKWGSSITCSVKICWHWSGLYQTSLQIIPLLLIIGNCLSFFILLLIEGFIS